MMTEIGKYLNVSYTYQLVPDGSTGLPLSNGSWTGMIGMLMSNVSRTDNSSPIVTMEYCVLYTRNIHVKYIFISFLSLH